MLEEPQRVVADERAQTFQQFALALSHGGNRVDGGVSDLVLSGVQRRLESVDERQLLTHGVDARLAVVQQRVERASMTFQTGSQ